MSEDNKTGMRVGRIIDVRGKSITFTRQYPSGIGTFQYYSGMPVCMGDIFETGKNTSACVRFDIGGEAIISPESKVQIVGQRDIDEFGNQYAITAKKMWAKFDKQGSQLQIKTSGGVIGIEG